MENNVGSSSLISTANWQKFAHMIGQRSVLKRRARVTHSIMNIYYVCIGHTPRHYSSGSAMETQLGTHQHPSRHQTCREGSWKAEQLLMVCNVRVNLAGSYYYLAFKVQGPAPFFDSQQPIEVKV